jgi:hypothetical protein
MGGLGVRVSRLVIGEETGKETGNRVACIKGRDK